jgi:hypothetical protein
MRIKHTIKTLLKYIDPKTYEISPTEFEDLFKAAKCKIVKEKMLIREARIRKSAGVADKQSFIKIFNCIVYTIFISVFANMIDDQ